MKKLILVAMAISLSGCVIAAPHHRMDGDDVDASQYTSGANECTQSEEAAGECVTHKKHHHHKKTDDTYKSSDGYTMITKHGVTLPDCEQTGGSQASQGSTCWYTNSK